MQRGMAERNGPVPTDKRIEIRIGIHVGDIIIEGDIFGDGVNIAAQLEGIAEPGGICISDDAYRQVRDKLDVAFGDAGEQYLKNIARPVRAYRVQLGEAVAPPQAAIAILVQCRCTLVCCGFGQAGPRLPGALYRPSKRMY